MIDDDDVHRPLADCDDVDDGDGDGGGWKMTTMMIALYALLCTFSRVSL